MVIIMRLVVGFLTYWTSLVIIVQAETNVDLFANFAALQVQFMSDAWRMLHTEQGMQHNFGAVLCGLA